MVKRGKFDARIVHQNIHPAKPLKRQLDQLPPLAGFSQIADHINRFTALFFNFRADFF